MTEKMRLLSLKPINYSFCFVFEQIDLFLSQIEEYTKKKRKDALKKWWMNRKASEMASSFLPAILDRIDLITSKLSKQEPQCHAFGQFVKFSLLECAMNTTFKRPRSAAAYIFPNTSFQYTRSRLRRKLENVYFDEQATKNMNGSQKKNKKVWLQMIAQKKNEYKQQYNDKKILTASLKAKSVLGIPCNDDNGMNAPPPPPPP